MKLWKKFVLKHVLCGFVVIFFFSYIIYVIVDFSLHISRTDFDSVGWWAICKYYFCHISKRFDVLVAFSLMISVTNLLYKLFRENAIFSLFLGGIRYFKILSLLIFCGCVFAFLSYVNYEHIYRIANASIGDFSFGGVSKEEGSNFDGHHGLYFFNGDRLYYRNFVVEEKAFYDVFFVRSLDDFCHMEKFIVKDGFCEGFGIDYFLRNSEGNIFLSSSNSFANFFGATIDVDKFFSTSFLHPKMLSLSDIVKELNNEVFFFLDRKQSLVSFLCFRISMILMPVVSVLLPSFLCFYLRDVLGFLFIVVVNIFSMFFVFVIVGIVFK